MFFKMIYFPMLLACSALLQVIIKIPPGPPQKKNTPKNPMKTLTVPISLAQHLLLYGKSYFWPKKALCSSGINGKPDHFFRIPVTPIKIKNHEDSVYTTFF
jgi:hypothetical protein